MKSIVNGCSTAGDVLVKKADFYHNLEYAYGIKLDEKDDYYDTLYDEYNLESLENEPQFYEAAKYISNINKLRRGKVYQNNLDAKYLIVTNSGDVLRFSKKQVERLVVDGSNEHVCDFAVSLDRITNLLWYKLGNGFGQKEYPTNVNVILKARELLASEISQNIVKIYSETKMQFSAGKITKEQLASRIIILRSKPTVPEEIGTESIEDDMNFSAEYLSRFEEEVKTNRDAIQESKRKLDSVIEENSKALAEKDSVIADKDKELQEKNREYTELEAELMRYRKDEYQKKWRKSIFRFVWCIFWKILVLVAVCLLAIRVCDFFGLNKSDTIGYIIGVVGLIPIVRTVVKKDKARCFSNVK